MLSLALAAATAITIPLVDDHKTTMTYAQVEAICERYADEQQKPCVVMREGDRVCYAYMDLQANTVGNVQCYQEKPIAQKEQDKP